MKKNRSLNLKYAGSQIFYFAAFAAMMGYASVFLLDKGCSNSQIGIALALSSIIAVLLQPMLASFADNHKNIEINELKLDEIDFIWREIYDPDKKIS